QDGEQYCDIYVKNTNRLKSASSMLVCFNGAVSRQGARKGPFFSGLSITESLDIPCFFISDPSLDLPEQLTLSWYAGNQHQPNFQTNVAKFLNAVAVKYTLKVLLLGGSGAGFAALSFIPE